MIVKTRQLGSFRNLEWYSSSLGWVKFMKFKRGYQHLRWSLIILYLIQHWKISMTKINSILTSSKIGTCLCQNKKITNAKAFLRRTTSACSLGVNKKLIIIWHISSFVSYLFRLVLRLVSLSLHLRMRPASLSVLAALGHKIPEK